LLQSGGRRPDTSDGVVSIALEFNVQAKCLRNGAIDTIPVLQPGDVVFLQKRPPSCVVVIHADTQDDERLVLKLLRNFLQVWQAAQTHVARCRPEVNQNDFPHHSVERDALPIDSH
jgi:hypothetical protein